MGDQFHHTDLVTVRFDNDDSGIYYYCNPHRYSTNPNVKECKRA